MSPAVAILQAKTHPQSRERLSANSIRVSLFGLDVRPYIRLIRLYQWQYFFVFETLRPKWNCLFSVERLPLYVALLFAGWPPYQSPHHHHIHRIFAVTFNYLLFIRLISSLDDIAESSRPKSSQPFLFKKFFSGSGVRTESFLAASLNWRQRTINQYLKEIPNIRQLQEKFGKPSHSYLSGCLSSL